MRDRTVTISSGGKTFSFTGWKIGWVCAPPSSSRAVRTVEAVPHLRERRRRSSTAIADGLGLPDDGFVDVRRRPARQARSARAPASRPPGSRCSEPAGTYFVTADIRSLGEHDGIAFCRALPERCGVVAVPNVVFYDDVDAGSPLVRFAFCKQLEVIDEAVVAAARRWRRR